jgi:hypothetical protein
MSDDKIFADGLIVKRAENAPDFVTCNLSFKVDEFIAFLKQHESNGWVNVDCMVGRSGKHYAALDTWKPTQGDSAKQGIDSAKQAAATASEPFEDSDVPF